MSTAPSSRGRPANTIGAHAGAGNNNGTIGICLVGDFHSPSVESSYEGDDPTPQQLTSLIDLMTWQSAVYDIQPSVADDTLNGHRDMPGTSTACPGDRLHAMLEGFGPQVKPQDLVQASYVTDPPKRAGMIILIVLGVGIFIAAVAVRMWEMEPLMDQYVAMDGGKVDHGKWASESSSKMSLEDPEAADDSSILKSPINGESAGGLSSSLSKSKSKSSASRGSKRGSKASTGSRGSKRGPKASTASRGSKRGSKASTGSRGSKRGSKAPGGL